MGKHSCALSLLSINLFLILSLTGCASSRTSASADASYRKLAEVYLQGYLAWRPQAGTSLGLHEYDGKISNLSRASIEAEHSRVVKFKEVLSAIDQSSLSPEMSRESRALLAAV